MSQIKSVLVGNNPLLVIASAALAFAGTQYYFSQDVTEVFAGFMSKILLLPVYVFSFIIELLGMGSITGQVAVIFVVLFISYAFIVICCSKALEIAAARSQARKEQGS